MNPITPKMQADEYYASTQIIPEELRGSADKILNYSGVSKEKADLFRLYLDNFRNMHDKSFTDQGSIKFREVLSTGFFEIYTAVLKKAQADKKSGRLIKMFLNYGYMDERLLSPDQTKALYDLGGKQKSGSNVFSMKAWLGKVYSGEEEPSVNDLGQDYQDLFREKKRRGELKEKDKGHYDADMDGRLKHEIDSMLKLGQRLCHGQSSSYVPILHRDMIKGDIGRALVTPARIEASIARLLEVDFSAFHREVVYYQADSQFGSQIIMKQVMPDIILSPTFGQRGVMWQTFGGKIKSSPARFVLPVFTDENLDDLITDLVAKFRWELSRETSGVFISKGNDGSLYADYCDYIQFYQKNRDLSEEAKEKIKTSLKRSRNSSEQLFLLDYHSWINYEANGLFRLNKVARELFFKHCPFPRSVRANLAEAPLYNALLTRFEMIREKQIKTLEARYAKLCASGRVHPDLLENLQYYKS